MSDQELPLLTDAQIDAVWDSMADRRKKMMPLAIATGVVCAIGLVLCVVQIIIGIIVLIFGLVFFGGKYIKVRGSMDADFEQVIVRDVYEKVFDDFKYEKLGELDEHEFKARRIMPTRDRFDTEDLMTGRYKDVEFRRADLHIIDIKHRVDSEGHRHEEEVTYFKGVWYDFEFPKSIGKRVVLATNRQGNVSVNNKKILQSIRKPIEGRVDFENEEFNKRFNVEADNAQDAFYLLTPHVMETLLEFDRKTPGELVVAFIDKGLHVGIDNGKNTMESSYRTKDSFVRSVRGTQDELRAIIELVDVFRMDRK